MTQVPHEQQPAPYGKLPQGAPYGQQAQTAPPAPAPAPPAPRQSKVGAIIAVVLGAILLLGGLPFGVAIGGIATVPQALGMIEGITEVAPSGAVTAKAAGDKFYLLGPSHAAGAVAPEFCTATGASGESIRIDPVSASAYSSDFGGRDFSAFAVLRAPSTGDIVIQCETEDGAVLAAPAFNLTSFFSPLFWWSVGGAVATLVGLVLLIVGIVLLARGPRTRGTPIPDAKTTTGASVD
ncbi:hypothetical protein FB468_0332 [Leucobacter komagatae]|uniref:Uncharacterized protein n=1 Tax=Leucobacter komagatae TaxID=55969 RepID=A0A542Y2N2_9MICO|nr:hypothetical protein [Leucobacter komagatae]TQL42342.1 hypothetical protein FB468_0332 [Leucobacter komagatae]